MTTEQPRKLRFASQFQHLQLLTAFVAAAEHRDELANESSPEAVARLLGVGEFAARAVLELPPGGLTDERLAAMKRELAAAPESMRSRL